MTLEDFEVATVMYYNPHKDFGFVRLANGKDLHFRGDAYAELVELWIGDIQIAESNVQVPPKTGDKIAVWVPNDYFTRNKKSALAWMHFEEFRNAGYIIQDRPDKNRITCLRARRALTAAELAKAGHLEHEQKDSIQDFGEKHAELLWIGYDPKEFLLEAGAIGDDVFFEELLVQSWNRIDKEKIYKRL